MNDIVVVTTSCYKYNHIWPIYFRLFKKYWPDCPYNFMLLTDVGKYEDIQVFSTGKDFGWASNLKKLLENVKEEKVILLVEDLLLCNYVNTKMVMQASHYLDKYSLGVVRLEPYHKQTKFGLKDWEIDENYGVINKYDNYSVSIQPSVWRKSTLMQLLLNGETAWDVEIKGSLRCYSIVESFISLKPGKEKIVPYIYGLKRGIYLAPAIELITKEGLAEFLNKDHMGS